MILSNLRSIAACVLLSGLIAAASTVAAASTETPLGAVTCTVPAASQTRFMERLRKHAARHAFEIQVSTTTTGQTDIQLWRQDLLVVGGNPVSSESFQFQAYSGNPKSLPAGSMILRTLHDLRHAFADIASCQV